MGELTVRPIVKEGLNPLSPVFETATTTDEFPNDGHTFLHYKNLDGAETPIVTVHSQVKCDQGIEDDIVAGAIPITVGELMIGPFDPGRFNNPQGNVEVTPDVAGDLKVACFSSVPE
jgi:hypothetical protein